MCSKDRGRAAEHRHVAYAFRRQYVTTPDAMSAILAPTLCVRPLRHSQLRITRLHLICGTSASPALSLKIRESVYACYQERGGYGRSPRRLQSSYPRLSFLGTRQEPRAIPGRYCSPPIPPIPAPPAVAASRNDVIVSTPSYSLYWNRSISSRTSRDGPRMHGAGFTSGSSPAGPRSGYISAGIVAACDSYHLGMSHQL